VSSLQREWNRRWKAFPRRLTIALGKFHAITLLMRCYEFVASKFFDVATLDKLTLDSFDSAKREAKAGKDQLEVLWTMTTTCCYANAIAFLADYSVHQMILLLGYYVYVREKRRQHRLESIHYGSMALACAKKSSSLALSRVVGLGFASLGGAAGSVIYPGWGTMAGISLGDSLAASLIDENSLPPVV
jgi:hypothetical protein